MDFRRCGPDDAARFASIVSPENVLSSEKDRGAYSKDMTEDLAFLPDLVVKPRDPEEVSRVLAYCDDRSIPVTPQGRRTCLSGGALPVFGGVALSLERLDRILEIDEKNHRATVEPYVLNHALRAAVEERGLFYPPDPASLMICSIGGNLAEGSGGPKCVKYGTTKDYVLNMEVVLASGKILWTGVSVLKNVMGYNLTQLFVGSEGTLGVITKGVLRLIPKPRFDRLMVASFSAAGDCSEAVNAILRAGIVPSAIEFMERNCLAACRDYAKLDFPAIGPATAAQLIVEFDGMDDEALRGDAREVEALLKAGFGSLEYVVTARDEAEKRKIWTLRRSALIAAKARSHCKEQDIAVPRYELPKVVDFLGRMRRKHDLDYVAWGHAGDGNLHVCLMQDSHSRDEFEAICARYLEEFYREICGAMKGSVTAEHGVGFVQRKFMADSLDPAAIGLMRSVKRSLDPKGIMNPGKIFLGE